MSLVHTRSPRLGRRGGNAGLTLIEVTVSMVLLTVITGAVLLAGESSSKTFRSGTARAQIESSASRTLDRIVRELMSTGSTVLVPDPTGDGGSSTLTFQQCVGVAGTSLQWGLPVRIELQLETGETDDGTDENENGLIDERRVTWTVDPGALGEKSATWCHDVREYLEGELPNGLDDNGNGLEDEAGLCFVRSGQVLTVRLTLEQLDFEGRTMTRTVETSVRLRN
jgi:hypothetical protein